MGLRPNGWQRMWILVAGVYGSWVVFLLSPQWPSETKEYRGWVTELISTVGRADPAFNDLGPEIRARRYPGLADAEVVKRIRQDFRDFQRKSGIASHPVLKFIPGRGVVRVAETFDNDLDQIDQRYQDRLAAVGQGQLDLLGRAMVAWGLPMGLLYGLGWSIAWVRRGFRGNVPRLIEISVPRARGGRWEGCSLPSAETQSRA